VRPCLLLFTKPAEPGRVKTRLIGDLNPQQAAALHAAFLDDLVAQLRGGDYELRLAWAVGDGEEMPDRAEPGLRQRGAGLGDRLYHALADAAAEFPRVAALGSDHPDLPRERVGQAFAALGRSDVALGPARDGGYYLIALRAAAVEPRLFEDLPWSTSELFERTLERCRELGLRVELLPEASDVDTPDDLRRLAERLAADPRACPRTRALLHAWGRLPVALPSSPS